MNVRTRWPAAAVAALALAGVLAGCSSGSQDRDSGAATSEIAPGVPNASAAPAAGDPAGSATSDSAGSSGGADRQSSTDSAQSVRIEPALIRTAELSVAVDDVPGVAARAESTARGANGVVAGDDRSGTGSHARATLVLKVPPDRMDTVLDQLGRLGTEESRSSSTQDVTEDVADVGSRVATMQASIARVRAILSRAEKIGDVVAVEGELSRRTTELEALQARQRALAGQTDYATITLTLRAKGAAAVPPPAERSGFLGGLTDGWEAFTTALGAVATGVGAVLPFLLVLVPIGLAVRWGLRRRVSPAASAPAGQPE